MIEGLLGRKIGMTQVFSAAGEAIPVTVIEVGPCVVTQIRNQERDGYEAVQIGFGEVKPKSLTKPEQGHLAGAGRLVRQRCVPRTAGDPGERARARGDGPRRHRGDPPAAPAARAVDRGRSLGGQQ